MTGIRLAPSILTADFGRLAEEVRAVEKIVDWFHLDVMDGHYVPNITFGPDIVAAIDAATDLPLHVHLMIEEPAKYAGVFAKAGADRISFHPEVMPDPRAAIEAIVDAGAGVGVAVHPDVSLESVRPYLDEAEVVLMMTVRPGFGGQAFMEEIVPKIVEAKRIVDSASLRADIEVDGGIKLNNVDRVVRAGADIIVAGSAIFDGVDAPAAARAFRDHLDPLESTR